jgi:hypothetical protein
MNEVCIEGCAPKRDCSSFELRPDLELPTMPQYPETDGLTWKERFVIEEAYLKKTIDFIQGRKAYVYGNSPKLPRRSLPDHPRDYANSEDEKVESLPDSANRDETLQGQEERPSTPVLAPEVD